VRLQRLALLLVHGEQLHVALHQLGPLQPNTTTNGTHQQDTVGNSAEAPPLGDTAETPGVNSANGGWHCSPPPQPTETVSCRRGVLTSEVAPGGVPGCARGESDKDEPLPAGVRPVADDLVAVQVGPCARTSSWARPRLQPTAGQAPHQIGRSSVPSRDKNTRPLQHETPSRVSCCCSMLYLSPNTICSKVNL